MGEGNDDNWVFQTNVSYTYNDIHVSVVEEVEMEEAMEEVLELEEVQDLEEEIENVATGYRYMSSPRWRNMAPAGVREYCFGSWDVVRVSEGGDL